MQAKKKKNEKPHCGVAYVPTQWLCVTIKKKRKSSTWYSDIEFSVYFLTSNKLKFVIKLMKLMYYSMKISKMPCFARASSVCASVI